MELTEDSEAAVECSRDIAIALARLDEASRGDREHEAEVPIFLLSSGWRTGSTLLQRVLMTDRKLLLWGEPLGRMEILSHLTDAIARGSLGDAWPADRWMDENPEADLATQWIANLYPPANDLRRALVSP